MDTFEHAWRSRDDRAMRKALLELIRHTILDADSEPALKSAMQRAPREVLDRATRQITPQELIDELLSHQSTVTRILLMHWLERAQPERLLALGDAWLKNETQRSENNAAITIGLDLAMGLSLYRNEWASALAKTLAPILPPDDQPRFNKLESLLVVGRHLKSAPEPEKIFWTEALVLEKNFNWQSKQPRLHLSRLARMPGHEQVIPVIVPFLPAEALAPDAADAPAPADQPRKKRRRKRRQVKRNTYGGGHEGPTEPEDLQEREIKTFTRRAMFMICGLLLLVVLLIALGIYLLQP